MESAHESAQGPRPPWRAIALLVAVGVGVRALLLALASPLDIQSDEANYLLSAALLERFGCYFDQHRYLWPPGYPWLLSQFVGPDGVLGGGARGIDQVRWLQVAASGATGALTMLFAWRLFSRRAALVAGLLWCVHLPLAAYTHLLFAEAVFLPVFLGALWCLVGALDRVEDGRGGADLRFVLSGALFGLALHLKELPLFLVPALGAVVFLRGVLGGGAGAVESLRRASLAPLVALVVTLPWTLRNAEVYGRPVVAGATLGENAYNGLNARPRNFDLVALTKPRLLAGEPPIEASARPWLAAPPAGPDGAPAPPWERAEDEHVHVIERQDAQVGRAVAFALDHPGYVARTRVQHWSDFVTPLSFFTRHFALGHYPAGSALAGPLRRPLVAASLVTSVAVLLLAVLGATLTLPRGPGRAVVFTVIGYGFAAATLVASSRFRVPFEPLLIVLAAGFLAHGVRVGAAEERSDAARIAAAGAGVLALLALWWLGWPQTLEAARMAWNGGAA